MSAIKDWLEYATKEDAEKMARAARLCSHNLYAETTYCNNEQAAREAVDKIISALDKFATMAERKADK